MADNLSPLVNLDLINQIYKTINAQITERVYNPKYNSEATLGSKDNKYKSAWISGDTSTETLNSLTLAKAAKGFTISGGDTSKTLAVEEDTTIKGSLTVKAATTITGSLTVSAATSIVQGLTVGAADTGTVTIKSGGTGNTTIVGPNGKTANLIDGIYTDSATTENSTDPTNDYLLKIGEVDANKFLAGPASGSGTADYRKIVASDLPEASASANGIITTKDQTFAGVKTFNEIIVGNINGAAAKTAHSISITDGADEPVAAINSWNGSADKILTIKGDANSPIATIATDSAITITHAKKGPNPTADTSKGDDIDQAPGFGETFKVTSATVDTYGHTSKLTDHTVTIPSSIATKDTNGLMSSGNWTKLDGIADNAEVNQNAFSNVTVGNTTISAGSKTATFTLVAGDNITLTPDSATSKIAIKATDTTYTIAPGDNNGQIKVTPAGKAAYPVSVTGLQSAAYTKSTDYAPYDHVHNYASSSSAGGTALTSEKLEGFSKSVSQSWGTQVGTFVHGEEVASANEEAGGCCWAFRKDCPNPGLISLFVDGKFYQDEGRYACIDTNGGTITGGLSVEGIASFTNKEASTDTSTGAVKISGGLGVGGDIYAGAVHNAVWNDLVDCMEVPENTSLEYGYCYSWRENSVTKTSRSSKNCIGIHSNTAGFAMGEKKTKTIRAAVAGFVLAYVDNLYPEGTPLTWGNDGVLTKCRLLKRVLHPERVIATFYREEKEEKWHDLPVSGRHWVKVR